MWYLWLIFALVVVGAPFASIFLIKVWEKKRRTKRDYFISVVIFTAVIWLVDLFYMSFIIGNIICKFIFGGLLVIFTFYGLAESVINKPVDVHHAIISYGLIRDLIVGIGLSIYLIYIIPDDNLREVVSIIIASIFGGLLTLVGVAWTIRFTKNERMEQDKKRDEERREEERLRLKPLFAVKDAKGAYESVISVEFCCRDTVFSDYHGYIENSDQSNFIFHSILDDDGNEQELNYSKTILKDRLVFLRIKGLEKTGKVFAVFSDILNNKYYYIMHFSAGRNRSDPMFLKEIAEISREEYMKEKNKRKKSEQ